MRHVYIVTRVWEDFSVMEEVHKVFGTLSGAMRYLHSVAKLDPADPGQHTFIPTNPEKGPGSWLSSTVRYVIQPYDLEEDPE